MLIIISPAKSLDFESEHKSKEFSLPDSLDYSQKIIKETQLMDSADIAQLMKISSELALLNHSRFANWNIDHNLKNAKQSIFAYSGDVYVGLDAKSFNTEELGFAQAHLRIISGLYGALRPLDLIMPYRLEMGVKLPVGDKNNLYEFWGKKITESINNDLKAQNSEMLINLASNEYFRSIDKKILKADVVTPVFKDFKNGTYKVIGFFAKKARGMFANYVVKNKIKDKDVEKLKQVSIGGYVYEHSMSNENEWVFTRDNKI